MGTNHYNRITQKEISLQNQNQIKLLTERITLLESQSNVISEDVKRILFFFNSDGSTKTEGLVEKTNRIDSDVRKIKSYFSGGKVAFIIISAVIGFFSGLLTFFKLANE